MEAAAYGYTDKIVKNHLEIADADDKIIHR
jgi:hypothetical protein